MAIYAYSSDKKPNADYKGKAYVQVKRKESKYY